MTTTKEKAINASLVQDLNWRYATKKFDAEKKVSDADLKTLLDVLQLSPSSYGLQPYHFFVITDPELRAKIRPISWDQSQVTDSSHLIVFAHQTDFGPELIDSYLGHVAEQRNLNAEALQGYGDFMKSKLLELPADQKANWTARQVYIALGNLMNAAAQMHIDVCPMEGFEIEKLNQILGLESKNLSAVAMAAVGYRSEADQTQHQAKVRRPENELFTWL